MLSTLTYLKLRKIKKLIDENQSEMEKSTNESEQMLLLQTHQLLKKMEIRTTSMVGTVILNKKEEIRNIKLKFLYYFFYLPSLQANVLFLTCRQASSF